VKNGKLLISGVIISVLLISGLIACAPSAEPTTPTEPAAVEKIKIGVISPMNFMQGQDAWDGAVMAAEEINEAGGVTVKGTKYEIEPVKADSNEFASIPDAVSAFERLITMDKVNFVVGGFRSEAALAQQELMAQYKMLYLNTGSASPDLALRVAEDYDKYKYFFRANSTNSILAMPPVIGALQIAVEEIRSELGIAKPKVSLVIQKSLYLDPMMGPLHQMTAAFGGEVVGETRPSPTASTLVAELSAAKEAGAQVCYVAFDGPAGVVVNKEWGSMKFPFVMAGWNAELGTKQHWEATNGYCAYAQALSWTARSGITKENIPFWDEYVKRYDRFPTVYSGTYSALYVLRAAVENADTMDADALVIELEKTDLDTAFFRQAFYGRDQKYPHDTILEPGYATGYVVQWTADGELRAVWPDGKPLQATADPAAWEGIRYSGTADYELPPWVVEFWKGK